jgi:hypothetical protein
MQPTKPPEIRCRPGTSRRSLRTLAQRRRASSPSRFIRPTRIRSVFSASIRR